MAYAVQFRRGTTAQHASFTGAAGEVTVNTDTNELVVHDGTTVGGHVIGTSNGSGGGASTLTDLNITDGTSGQVLTTDGAGTFTFTTLSSGSSGSTNDLSTIISPAAFAYVNTTSDGSGTNISWANWNASSGSMDFAFTTSQPDTNYAVISDVEGRDDTNIMVTSKTTTGFQISIYDDNGDVRSPDSTATFSVIVYSSVPTLSGTTSSTGSASSTEIFADMAALIAKTGMSTGDQAYISSTDKLYLYTGTGWYLIATVQNDAPSAITNVTSAYNLAIDGTPTVITAVSTDPEGFPLTWSYAITSGSLGSTATISQTDNVFTITPSTNSADEGIFTLTISATDGANGAVNANTSISLAFVVINSRYTTLLATATETSDNSTVTDSSTNNHAITVRGDVRVGTSSPYRSGGYSTYFDGTGGDYLRSPTHADFGFSTDDFTIECWYYPVSRTQPYPRVWNFGPYWNDSISLAFLDRHADRPTVFSLSAFALGEGILTSTTTVEDNTWYHLTVERSGPTITLYVNGVAEDTYNIGTSQFLTSSSSYVTLGGVSDGISQAIIEAAANAYIRDFRYVKGTAIYDGNFAPPTSAFESDANTKLLISSSLPYIKDSSSNSHDITVTGDVSIMPFAPYDYREYNPNDHGGSVYFPGGGAAIFTPTNASFGFGTGDYTMEGWFNFDDHGAFWGGDGSTIFATSNPPGDVSAHLWVSARALRFYSAGADRIVSSPVSTQEWHHIALVRSSGNTKLYIDGTQEGSTYADSLDYGTTAPFSIASHHDNGQQGPSSKNLVGYVSDFKVIKGQAIYTSNFTSPTAPLSSTGTEIHIKGTDASIIDKSQSDSHLTLFGNTTGSTTQVKFTDTKSMYFDGTGDYITVDDGFHFGTGDFTFEFWLYPTENLTSSGAQQFINAETSGSGVTWSFACYPDGYNGLGYNGLTFSYGLHGSYTVGRYVNNYWPTQNTWTHLAVQRRNGIIEIFVNGTSQTLTTYGQNSTFSDGANLTSNYTSRHFFNGLEGYVQDLRITKGLGRHTANFTPPTLPLKG